MLHASGLRLRDRLHMPREVCCRVWTLCDCTHCVKLRWLRTCEPENRPELRRILDRLGVHFSEEVHRNASLLNIVVRWMKHRQRMVPRIQTMPASSAQVAAHAVPEHYDAVVL